MRLATLLQSGGIVFPQTWTQEEWATAIYKAASPRPRGRRRRARRAAGLPHFSLHTRASPCEIYILAGLKATCHSGWLGNSQPSDLQLKKKKKKENYLFISNGLPWKYNYCPESSNKIKLQTTDCWSQGRNLSHVLSQLLLTIASITTNCWKQEILCWEFGEDSIV